MQPAAGFLDVASGVSNRGFVTNQFPAVTETRPPIRLSVHVEDCTVATDDSSDWRQQAGIKAHGGRLVASDGAMPIAKHAGSPLTTAKATGLAFGDRPEHALNA
jgi:hypothetical protein